MNKRSIGTAYENIAAGFLKYCGMTVLERNYRCRYGEIDIIAQDREAICFVEVKYRSSADFGYPSEAVNKRKQSKIIAVSNAYLSEHRISDAVRRYDVVEIIGDKIRILKNSFGG